MFDKNKKRFNNSSNDNKINNNGVKDFKDTASTVVFGNRI